MADQRAPKLLALAFRRCALNPTNASDALIVALLFTHERIMLTPDGITAPATRPGWAGVYVGTADGDLKVVDGSDRILYYRDSGELYFGSDADLVQFSHVAPIRRA